MICSFLIAAFNLLLPALTSAAPTPQDLPEPQMDIGGWILLGVAWTSVTCLLVWSFVRVLSDPKPGPDSDAS